MKVDTRDSVRTVTHNNFITAEGLMKLSIKARKMLYIAISQCKLSDDDFGHFEISALEFADLMGIANTHVYQEADSITDELMVGFLKFKDINKEYFHKYHIFEYCYYENGIIHFALSAKMSQLFLHLKRNFSTPLLSDFLKMRSPYSMAIWHLMQREMGSKKPDITQEIVFDLSLAEIREVTATTEKFTRLSDIKRYVIDKALREIRDNCAVDISYTYIKRGHTVVGFHFTVINALYHCDIRDIPQATLDKVDLFKLNQAKKVRELTPDEKQRYNELIDGAYQMELHFGQR